MSRAEGWRCCLKFMVVSGYVHAPTKLGQDTQSIP